MNRPDPIAFLPLPVDTSVHLYHDFIHLFSCLLTVSEASVLDNELPEESDQFRFLRIACFANLKDVVRLIIVKKTVIRISIPLDLSSFRSLSRFIRPRRPTRILAPFLVLSLRVLSKWYILSVYFSLSLVFLIIIQSFNVTFSFPCLSTFCILMKMNHTFQN